MFREFVEFALVVFAGVSSLLVGAGVNSYLAWQLDPDLLQDGDTWKCIVILAPITAFPVIAMALVIYLLFGESLLHIVLPLLKLAFYLAVGFMIGFIATHVVLHDPMAVLGVGCVICLLSWMIQKYQFALVGSGMCLISIIVAFSLGV